MVLKGALWYVVGGCAGGLLVGLWYETAGDWVRVREHARGLRVVLYLQCVSGGTDTSAGVGVPYNMKVRESHMLGWVGTTCRASALCVMLYRVLIH